MQKRKMKYDFYTIRLFLEKVEWMDVKAATILWYGGDYKEEDYRRASIHLLWMKKKGYIKRLENTKATYATLGSEKHRASDSRHNRIVRYSLSRYLHDNGVDHIDTIEIEPRVKLEGKKWFEPDAKIESKKGTVYFEVEEIRNNYLFTVEKLTNYYAEVHGAVYFIVYGQDEPRPGTYDRIYKREINRRDETLKRIKDVFPFKPGKARAAAYLQYIQDGKTYTYKG